MRKHLLRTLAASALVAGALLVPAAARAAPPANDDFANATVVSSLPFSDTVSIVDAGYEVGETANCGVSNTVWYSFTATSDEVLRLDTSGSNFFGPVVNAYRQDGTGVGGLSFLGCSTFGSQLTFSVQAGKTYYLQGGSSFYGAGDLRLNVDAIPPPPNDAWANATSIPSLPFTDSVRDLTAATSELGEPASSCISPAPQKTIWYAFTAVKSGSVSASIAAGSFASGIAAYTGNSLAGLSEVGCGYPAGVLTIHVDTGTTYYFQVGGRDSESGSLQFQLVTTPPPVAGFAFSPSDPSIFDTVQLFNTGYDPGGEPTYADWDFGDGTTLVNGGCCPTHRYATDGDYTVTETLRTSDGRTAATRQVVHVQTHDVSIAKVLVPQTASVGQTRTITVGLTDSRYPEVVQVQLLRSVAGGGWQQVGASTQSVPVRGANRTTNFTFNYTFAPDDAMLGKVSFQAIATIQNARDAIPTDNTFISLPTRVTK